MEKYNLTNSQKSIWMTEQFYKGTNINNIVGILKIDGNANLKALEQAVNYFIMRNDSFKTKIIIEENLPKQYFDKFEYTTFEVINIKNEKELQDFEEQFPMQIIDINNKFLFSIKLLSLPNGSAIFAIIAHHLIADAWTMSLLIDEIHNNYLHIINGNKINLNPNPSYIEHIKKQEEYSNSNRFEKDKIYWQKQFEKMPNVISFKNNTNISIKSNRKIFSFDNTTVNQIRNFCLENKISEYIFLLSVFNFYFANIFNFDNFVIGNPVLNRANSIEKQMTGMFVSIMPFVVNLQNVNSFIDLCQNMSSTQKQMYKHIHYPYHEILNYIKNKHDFSGALYDIVFSYQNAKIPSYTKWLSNHSQAESLQIHIKDLSIEDRKLSIHYDFLTDLFTEKDIDIMNSRIQYIINQVLENHEIKLNDLEITTYEEKHLLLGTYNSTHVEYNKNTNLVKEFEKIVEKYPNDIAVIDKNNSYTYEELNKKANFLAQKIIDKNIKTEIIAFSLPRKVDIIVSILAVLKSGHTYMPIDPEYPIERIKFMLENSNTKLLITNEHFFSQLNYNCESIFYEKLNFDRDISNLNKNISSEELCYIMYTSGSTGIPKAVAIKHYNVLNFVKSMQERLDYSKKDQKNIISVTTVCFDIFVFELYPTILSGLTLVIADELESRSPKLLSQIINKHKISKILTTPSRIELLTSSNEYLKELSSIDEFILGGEALPITLLNKLQKETKAHIFNLYGPTETTVYSCFKDVTNTEKITIGKPINNTQIYILNKNNKLQATGFVGEICIGGDGVGNGYYNNDEKTKLAFIKNPYGNDIIYKTGDLGFWNSNGELECVGRKDYQVKIRGYRIELEDISNNILNFPNVEKCTVIDREDLQGKKYLCAYLVGKEKIDILKLKMYLVNIIPNYMIPSYFVQLDEFPLTVNHKIDKKNLPDPKLIKDEKKGSSIEHKKTCSKIEKDLCNIFKECLEISDIDIDCDIFEYNIDSLDIIRIQTKMLDYDYKLNTQDFYTNRTIENLALIVENKNAQEVSIEEAKYLSNVNNSFYKYPLDLHLTKNTYNNILLLGATGYLGIHILNEIVTNYNFNITCILRKKDATSATKRLCDLYKYYFNKDLPLNRLEIVDSDIRKQNLGLNSDFYEEIVKRTDIVINCVANVKYYGYYQSFKEINVDVVRNLIDFCSRNNAHLVHISTMGISGNYLIDHKNYYSDFTENDFYIGQEFKENVYIQTKFKAEKLIYEKAIDSLNASIFRVGNLTSRFSDGVFQKNFDDNAFYNILRIILKYHIIPNTMLNEFLEFTPIDYCAKAICMIIFNIDINKKVFHIFNENYIQLSKLLKIFENIGFKTDIISGKDFKDKILMLSNKYIKENILKGVVNDIDNERGLSYVSKINQKNINTNICLEKMSFHWPKIEEEYIEKIINYLQSKKLLD